MRTLCLIVLGSCLPLLSEARPLWDSVAVFHRPERVVIQVNEEGAVSRLQAFMNLAGPAKDFVRFSADESIKVDCGRNSEAASCILRFLPSAQVKIVQREVRAEVTLQELQFDESAGYAADFLNSNGDYLHLRIESGHLQIHAGKR